MHDENKSKLNQLDAAQGLKLYFKSALIVASQCTHTEEFVTIFLVSNMSAVKATTKCQLSTNTSVSNVLCVTEEKRQFSLTIVSLAHRC